MSEVPVATAVADYARLQPTLQRAAADAATLITTILDEASINYLAVTGRAKTLQSFAAKASRLKDGVREFTDPLAQLGDLIGLRIITYVRSDVAAVVALLADEFELLDDRDLGAETASEGRFGYASRHLQLRLPPARQVAYADIGTRQIQVQLRTVLQHAWAEFEHDIRYKGNIPEEHRPDFDRRFSLAAGLIELADNELSTIRDRLRESQGPVTLTSDEDPRISATELAAFLAGQFADAGWSRTDRYEWMAGIVLELGITSLAELADIVRSVDADAIDRAMAYHYPAGAVRRLDDILLRIYAERYLGLRGNAHRVELLRARLAKFSS
ncbi:MAG: (p)ppGpp synthetase [Nocardioides sp.]